jgi:flagellar motor switch protein FliM
MTSKLLSQNEVDALLNQFADVPDSEDPMVVLPKKEVVNYDFKHPKLVSKEQMRSLRNLHETFARNMSVAFTNMLRTIVDIQFLTIDQVVYSEFVQSIASPSALFIFTVEEWGGEAVMEIDPRFCVFSVERQSGGRSKEMTFRREMTNIEEKVMSRVMNRVYSELQEAWAPYMQLTVYQHSYESNPENIQIISAMEPAIVVFYQISIYDSRAVFNLCYPYALLEKALSNSLFRNANQMRKDDLEPEQRAIYRDHLKTVEVPVQAVLGKTKITIKDLIKMQVGDAITLNRRVEQPLDVLVNNHLKMKAFPGQMRRHKAIKVFDFIDKDNKE